IGDGSYARASDATRPRAKIDSSFEETPLSDDDLRYGFSCPSCAGTFSISLAKIPPVQARFNCPKCGKAMDFPSREEAPAYLSLARGGAGVHLAPVGRRPAPGGRRLRAGARPAAARAGPPDAAAARTREADASSAGRRIRDDGRDRREVGQVLPSPEARL